MNPITLLDENDIGFEGTEREQSQLPAVALLMRFGYHFLNREEALALREGKASRVLLEDVLRAQLDRLNTIHYKGRETKFTQANLRRAVQALDDVPLSEGTQRAGEAVYDLLRLGKSLEQTVEGDTKSFTLKYVDWEHPENNVYHVTTEYTLLRASSNQLCRPDVVLFVNGIPFVVIECKRRDIEIERAISGLIAYQRPDYVPELFKFVQMTIATNVTEAKYATAGTDKKFWAVWRAREPADETIEALLHTPLPPKEQEAVLSNFVQEERQFYAVEKQGRAVTEQDRTLYQLCRPERLLEMVGRFLLYDNGVKKIARYQQYDAVKRAMARIEAAAVSTSSNETPRQNKADGVIWHTQGSGKSLTMVMLANAIALSKKIENPRIILVTDRVNLDKQIAGTFRACGLEPKRAGSGADLRRLIADGRAAIITTLVQKFQTALTHGEIADTSPNIFVLVDEGHRTQYGALNAQMRRVFPNACYIGFTGTPLLQEDKSTVAKFGGIIDSYDMGQAVADKAVVPLLYERRHIPQEVDKQNIDRWFDRLSQGLTDDQKKDLKQKYSRSTPILKTDQRLHEIAYDVWAHYRANWQGADGFKAQLVARDRLSAIKLHDLLEEIGQANKHPVSSAVVISLNKDDREGYEEAHDVISERISEFSRKIIAEYGSEEKYDDSIVGSFLGAGEPEILIVVDKLLTGFDAPCNTVLYLDRRLAHHSLLQAIARVNRLYTGKDFGYVLDYAGVLGELDRALNAYAALKSYDLADIEGSIESVREQIDALPGRHGDLLEIFKTVQNRSDEEEFERHLADEDLRHQFYTTLTSFSKCLKVALSTELFYEETAKEKIDRYKGDLKRFQKLRASVQRRYAETIDLRDYEPQIAKLLDTYVKSDTAQILTSEPVDIFDTAAMNAALEELGTKTSASKADTIANTMKRTITERMDQDPARYRKFSEMIEDTIQQFRMDLLSELDYYRRILELRDQLISRSDSSIPARLVGKEVEQAYYRITLERLSEIAIDAGDREIAVDIALMINKSICSGIVVDWRNKTDVINRMKADIDDGFFLLSQQGKIKLEWMALEEIAGEALRVARSRIA